MPAAALLLLASSALALNPSDGREEIRRSRELKGRYEPWHAHPQEHSGVSGFRTSYSYQRWEDHHFETGGPSPGQCELWAYDADGRRTSESTRWTCWSNAVDHAARVCLEAQRSAIDDALRASPRLREALLASPSPWPALAEGGGLHVSIVLKDYRHAGLGPTGTPVILDPATRERIPHTLTSLELAPRAHHRLAAVISLIRFRETRDGKEVWAERCEHHDAAKAKEAFAEAEKELEEMSRP